MTMGPDPMISILWMSLRFGIVPSSAAPHPLFSFAPLRPSCHRSPCIRERAPPCGNPPIVREPVENRPLHAHARRPPPLHLGVWCRTTPYPARRIWAILRSLPARGLLRRGDRAPRCESSRLGALAQPAVYCRRCLAPAVDCTNHQRGAADRIAGREYPWLTALVTVGYYIPFCVKLQA